MPPFRQYFDPAFKQKTYPDGYFAHVEAVNRKPSGKILGIVLFIILGILFNIPLWLGGITLAASLSEGEYIGVSLAILAVGLLWLAGFFLLARLLWKRASRSRRDWMETVAKSCHLNLGTLEEFDQEFKGEEASYLTLLGFVRTDTEMRHYLTPHYVMASNDVLINILPIRDILGAAWVPAQFADNALAVGLITKNNSLIITANAECGGAFLDFLKKTNPAIEMDTGTKLTAEHFNSWLKELQKGKA